MSDINCIKIVAGKFKRFLKRETVLSIAWFSAIISMCFIHPDEKYLAYVDFKVLACLFCLMAVVAGLRKTGLFDRAAGAMLRYTVSTRNMSLVLILSTFLLSMAITNDVALITFIPLSMILMKKLTNSKTRTKVITFQTIAANIGSSLTPIGNPQNLSFVFILQHECQTVLSLNRIDRIRWGDTAFSRIIHYKK